MAERKRTKMDREIRILKFEFYHRMAETLPVPVIAYGVYHDEAREVILVYEEEDDAFMEAA